MRLLGFVLLVLSVSAVACNGNQSTSTRRGGDHGGDRDDEGGDPLEGGDEPASDGDDDAPTDEEAGDDDVTDDDGGGLVYAYETPENYCYSRGYAYCQRTYNDCDFEDEDATASCAEDVEEGCDAETYSDEGYDATLAQSCVDELLAASCDVVFDLMPLSCFRALPPEVPSTEECAALTEGATGEISDEDTLYVWNRLDGIPGYAEVWCITLTAGQALTVTTGDAAEASSSIDDTVLSLFDAEGTLMAFHDDIDYDRFNHYSEITYTSTSGGAYTLVVPGYDTFTVGDYALTVTLGE